MKLVTCLLLVAMAAQAELAVTVSPVKITGQKAVVPLAMKNGFAEKIESARAVVFLLDEQGKSVTPPTTRWVIGGSQDRPNLDVGVTNTFHFVITADKPFVSTNVTAKVSFSRVVLEGGKLADVAKDVQIQNAGK